MDYLSKGAKRFFVAVAVVLAVLALPVFGVDSVWAVLKPLGVPVAWPGVALVALVSLAVGLFVGWLVHCLLRVVMRRRRGV